MARGKKVGSEVFTMVTMKSMVFCVGILCSLEEAQCFRGQRDFSKLYGTTTPRVVTFTAKNVCRQC
jgi:predicted transcriptional regulator